MDVDELQISASQPAVSTSNKARALQPVVLPSDSPFELEAYASLYKGSWQDPQRLTNAGRRKIQRLLFIARSSPSLCLDAYTLAAAEVKATTLDAKLYSDAILEHNAKLGEFEQECAGSKPSPAALAAVGRQRLVADGAWLSDTKRNATSTQDRLDVELKTYQNSLIKESIRMGHRDIGTHLHNTGDIVGATRAFTKSRDFCATASHVLEMCLSIIELALESYNYALLRNHTLKAETALETAYPSGSSAAAATQSVLGAATGNQAAAAKAASAAAPGPSQPTVRSEAQIKQRQVIQDQLHVATGAAELAQGNYARAARALLRVGPGAKQDEYGNLLHPADIVLYAVLCGLAAFDRGELRRLIIENSELRPLMELEPHLKALLTAFYESRYKEALDLLDRHSPRYLLDVHMSSQVGNLLAMIRSRAIRQYFEPFASAQIPRMAQAFGFGERRMEDEIVSLIGSGELKARIDSRNKVIIEHAPSQRSALFKHAIEVGDYIDRSTRALHLRTRLMAAEVIVKPPKNQPKESTAQQSNTANGDAAAE